MPDPAAVLEIDPADKSVMLNTRLVMIASSICLGIGGLACLFVPAESLVLLGMTGGDPVIVQILGALYLASAASNWAARGSMIGGIYARPLSVANFVHFLVGASVLARGIGPANFNPAYITVALVYLVFAVLFVLMLFGRLGDFSRG